MLRRQIPVYSPVSWSAIVAGAAAAAQGDRESRAAARLVDTLRVRYGARDALLTNSGTSALRLAIEGAVSSTERPVALPGYGCYDLASAAEGARAPVALYDLDPTTLGPDGASLASLKRVQPAAVVVAHWFGHLADAPAAGALLPDAVLIEDAAQGVGGILRGRPLGSFGSVSVLSFGRGKGTTGGGGGALLAHDERGMKIVQRARAQLGPAPRGFASLAALAAQLVLGRPLLYGIPASLPFLQLGETVYHPPRPPQGATPASVAVLERIWAEADREVAIRKAHAVRLAAALARAPSLRAVASIPEGEPGYLRLPAVASDAGAARRAVATGTALGVAQGYPKPLSALPSLRPWLVTTDPLPGATALAERLLTLPTHRFLRGRDLARLESWVAGA